MAENYQKKLEKTLQEVQEEYSKTGKVPKLFLHSCCAPCSSYVLEYLSQYMEITVYYYNPNISPESEYLYRVEEQKHLIERIPSIHTISFQEGLYEPQYFFSAVKGHETEPEGSERCSLCYELRLRKAAEVASQKKYDYFTTTLSISPMKHAEKLNEIGRRISEEFQIPYLYSDFKKKGGYQRSIELSHIYHLYRQDYCGCIFSKMEAEKRKERS